MPSAPTSASTRSPTAARASRCRPRDSATEGPPCGRARRSREDRPRMRQTVGAVLALAVLLLGAAPAAPPDYPVRYIHLDELQALLARGDRLDRIHLRPRPAHAPAHPQRPR